MAMKKVNQKRSILPVQRDAMVNLPTDPSLATDPVSEILAIDRRLESPQSSTESTMESEAEFEGLVDSMIVAGKALPILAKREASALERWRTELRSRPQTILACIGLLAVLLVLWMLHDWGWSRIRRQPWMAMAIWGIASLSLGGLAWVGVVGATVAILGMLLEHRFSDRTTVDRLGTKS